MERFTHYSTESAATLRFLRLMNSPGILLLIIGGFTALIAFYPNGIVLAVLGITMTFASGYGLRDRTIIFGFVSILIIAELLAPLEHVFPYLSLASAVVVVLVVPVVASIIRVMLAKRG